MSENQTRETRPAYLCLPSIAVDRAHVHVADRTADLGTAVVYFNGTSLQMHITGPEDARALAAAFPQAADLLEAAVPETAAAAAEPSGIRERSTS